MSRGKGRRSDEHPVVVIGAGLTGLSAALRVGGHALLFEAGSEPGGLARSERVEGYTFDRTGHWLHLNDPGTKRQVNRWLPGGWIAVERKSRAYAHGVLGRYPFQVHLRGQPPEILKDCLEGLWRLKKSQSKPTRTFEDFIYAHFGKGIADHFLIPYNEKTWGVHPRQMTAAWCRRFVPVPPVEHILAGAVGAAVPEMGYNVRFFYPRSGGIGALPQAMAGRLDPDRIFYGSPVEAVDHKRRAVRVGGQWVNYRALVSTMPLPELCRRLTEPPASVVRAARRLRWTPVLYLDVATSAPPGADFHWVYVPEKRYPFYRAGIYSNAVPYMAPKGCASLYVELATRDRSLSLDDVLADALDALSDIGVLTGPDTVRFARLRIIEYAYVIYDHHYAAARRSLLSFFTRHGIYSCGRYGSWVYNAMEDCLLEGARIGQTLRNRARAG